ncbi:hypothetical protein M407DRAFT_221038 [Tulasnella calospora MUT 4182]|uniref:Uncharacterized protein n=1 Tax=Tulasnella calospora MUT 4182 TaxID=1051891 RepID=A0A0C3LBI5_9AGAM|nr:hypothetical protein M407DRAFT_221038 [Tulasnella calospora MUT 4182]
MWYEAYKARDQQFPCNSSPRPRYDGYIMSNFRALLQAQPLLEVLELPNSSPAVAGWVEHPDLHSTPATSPLSKTPPPPKITCSDVPNLRSLVAIPCVAASFLTIAPKLESLSISPWDDQMSSLLLYAGKHGHQIRNLSFELTWREFMDWDGIENVLRCFPNVETLTVATRWEKQYKDEESGKDFLGQISHKIHLLPLLRKLEVYYERNYETEVPLGLEIPSERLVALKTSCPFLEYVIDPLGRIWAYTVMTDRECCGLQTLGRLTAP